MRRDAVIFDLDGTLLDTLRDLADSTNAVLRRHGHPARAVSEYRAIVGDGIHNQVRRALPERVQPDADALERLVREVRSEYAKRWDEHTRPYPGVPALLNALEAREVPKAVLSNKPHDFTVRVVGRLLTEWEFRTVRGAGPDTPLKPDPAGALETARALEATPERVLYVGDTDTDMRTARAAGMPAVGALWGFRQAAELQQAGADELIERPGELLDLL
ncbi:MAG: HAD family hydrolase [Planctomycetota bacterium]